jgi:chorismate dehydratase
VPPTRIVGVSFLNARPLLAGLEAGLPAPFAYEFTVAEPAVCAALLEAGSAQVGLVPVAALPALPQVWAYPHLGIAAAGETTSVLLVAKVPLPRVRVLAAHTASRTSVVLARLLLAALHGVRPTVVPAVPPVEAMLGSADAAVIIGDAAMACPSPDGLARYDLAAMWRRWRGLPFVFALWGIASPVPSWVPELLESSYAYAQQRWEVLLPRWAQQHGAGLPRTREYLENRLRFRLGEAERRAVQEFLQLAAEFALLPAREEIFWHG